MIYSFIKKFILSCLLYTGDMFERSTVIIVVFFNIIIQIRTTIFLCVQPKLKNKSKMSISYKSLCTLSSNNLFVHYNFILTMICEQTQVQILGKYTLPTPWCSYICLLGRQSIMLLFVRTPAVAS